MRIALFDYGTGNLHSLDKALVRGGAEVRIAVAVADAVAADALVLPGVGAFGAAAARLAAGREAIREAVAAGLPVLGICLGMQLLFESSEEGAGLGLGLLDGRVRRLRARRIPHMGWNGVASGDDPLFAGASAPVVYFANSYVVEPGDPACVIGWTVYDGDRFPAAVRRGPVWGVQFHPEKSGAVGLRMVMNFLRAVS